MFKSFLIQSNILLEVMYIAVIALMQFRCPDIQQIHMCHCYCLLSCHASVPQLSFLHNSASTNLPTVNLLILLLQLFASLWRTIQEQSITALN